MKKKIYNIKDLGKKINHLKKRGKKVVHCHGVFDILHAGHVKHFNSAKKLGDILVVTITQDQYVNKGPNRPIFPVDVRMQCIAALENVDYVAANSSSNAVKAIKTLKPNIYCKGKDYINNKLDITGQINQERKAIRNVGGKLFYTNDELYSSSKIINTSGFSLSDEQKKFLDKLRTDKNFKDNSKISKIINSFFDLKILVIGETIIDEYVFCEALGKSGKEPVLVLRDLYKEKYLGGASAIARNLSSFCKKITLLSCIGQNKDQFGFIKKNLPHNIKRNFIAKKNSTTIVKTRFVDDANKNKVLGVYSINDSPLDRNQSLNLNKKIIQEIKKHDLVIVSDYGHGFLSSQAAKKIIKYSKFIAVNAQLNAANIGHHTISNYIGANLVIINENEMRHEMRDKNETVENLIKKLANKLKSQYTTVTSGNKGSKIYSRKTKKLLNCPAFATNIVDKVGTGDAMLALLSIGIYKKLNINFSMLVSALAAAMKIRFMGNSSQLKKIDIIKSLQAYLS